MTKLTVSEWKAKREEIAKAMMERANTPFHEDSAERDWYLEDAEIALSVMGFEPQESSGSFSEDAWKASEKAAPEGPFERVFETNAHREWFYIGALWARRYLEELNDE